MDQKLIGNMKVRQLTAYLMMPLGKYLNPGEVADMAGMVPRTAHMWLGEWAKAGLVDQKDYGWKDLRFKHQYRRIFNRVTIIPSGVLFELVKEG